MSTLPDNEFDLEKLFLPAWAQQEPSSAKYAHYEGEEEKPDRRDAQRGPRRPRGDHGEGRREGFRPRVGRGERPRGPRPAAGQAGSDAERRGPRPGRGESGERRGPRGREHREHREPLPPLPEVNVTFLPEQRGVESLARQIKMAGRAYPLFGIAQMILQKPERHTLVFSVKKDGEGKPLQPMFVCALDDTLWLSEDDAVSHILRRHFATFYQAERTPTEPPKGKYTFVAQCGMSGIVLGPPNYHDYQNQLRKLHSERFSRMPFEVYKSRVKIVRDEEVVKKWVEDQSWKTEYVCLNMPEPLRLPNMEAVEKHFRENHKDNVIKSVESHTTSGTTGRGLRSPELSRLVRNAWEEQRRFPLQIATSLSQQFASHGLQFFKVNRTVTHVSVARPHYLDLEVTPVSDGVKRIVDFINTHPRCTRRQLVEALAPSPPPAPIPVAPAPTAESPPQTGAPLAESAAASPAQEAQATLEQTAVIADLHWLIHQGHVIEFANGVLETAKKPAPKPPKPPKTPEKPAEAAPGTEATPATQPSAGSSPGEAPLAQPETAPVELAAEPQAKAETPEAAVTPEAPPSEEGLGLATPPAEEGGQSQPTVSSSVDSAPAAGAEGAIESPPVPVESHQPL